MTISTQTFRFRYTSTGASTLYPYTNKILDENDLKVYEDDVLKTIGTDYSVTGVGEAAGGNVEFVVNPVLGADVLITKDGVEFTQETDYVKNDAFPAESHEDALDKLTNIAQKIWDYTRRSVKLAITSTFTDLELPEPEASKYIGWNAAGTALENLSLVTLGAISDTAYNSTTWDGDTEVAPSKNTVRDEFENKLTGSYATAAEITTGTEAAKAIAPDQLALTRASAAEITTGTAVKMVMADQLALTRASAAEITTGTAVKMVMADQLALTRATAAEIVTGTAVKLITADQLALTRASAAEAQTGTDNTKIITPLRMREGFNAGGSAPVYACRAWVNFNGTGVVAIRASGNVSSITDNGVGDYTVNFTTAMPDANYSACGTTNGNGVDRISVVGEYMGVPRSAGSIRIQAGWSGASAQTGAPIDGSIVTLSVFR